MRGSSTSMIMIMCRRAWLHDHYTRLNNFPPPHTEGTHGYPLSVIRVYPTMSSLKPPPPLLQRPAQRVETRTRQGMSHGAYGQPHRRMLDIASNRRRRRVAPSRRMRYWRLAWTRARLPWMPAFIQRQSTPTPRAPTPLQYCMTRRPSCLQARTGTGIMHSCSHVGWGGSISGNRVARSNTHRFLGGIGAKAFRRSAREAMPPTSTWRDADRHHWPRPSRDTGS